MGIVRVETDATPISEAMALVKLLLKRSREIVDHSLKIRNCLVRLFETPLVKLKADSAPGTIRLRLEPGDGFMNLIAALGTGDIKRQVIK